jgi:prespore-specific regulator
MKTVRQDAWSEEDDVLLAEIILRHIREGSTQLLAFEEAGERLGRTAAACGYRWNACVRKQYQAAIEIAKAQRKEQKSLIQQTGPSSRIRQTSRQYEYLHGELDSDHDAEGLDTGTDITWHDVIRFLKQNKNEHQSLLNRIRHLERDVERYELEATTLRHQYDLLHTEYQRLQEEHSSITEDYKTLVRIMERARKMTILEPELTPEPTFEKEEQPSEDKQTVTGNMEQVDV